MSSVWIAFDPVTAKNGRLEFVRGSHLWNGGAGMAKVVGQYTSDSGANEDVVAEGGGGQTQNDEAVDGIMDIEKNRTNFDIVSASLMPGDAVIFHGQMLHHSNGNRSQRMRRRGVSCRYIGDDILFLPKKFKGNLLPLIRDWPASCPSYYIAVAPSVDDSLQASLKAGDLCIVPSTRGGYLRGRIVRKDVDGWEVVLSTGHIQKHKTVQAPPPDEVAAIQWVPPPVAWQNQPTISMQNNICAPALAFGTYKICPGEETINAVLAAFNAGFRHIDTAQCYGNEASVGEAFRKSGLPREDVFITTKFWPQFNGHGTDQALSSCRRSVEALGMGYIDLYLVHTPEGGPADRAATWRGMEAALKEGLTRSIGVSNYGVLHICELMALCSERPAVNQFEVTPYNTQVTLVEMTRDAGIVPMPHSSLTKAKCLSDPKLAEIAQNEGMTPAQVLLVWSLQRGFSPVVKAATPSHIREDFDATRLTLSNEAFERLTTFNRALTTGWDPTQEK